MKKGQLAMAGVGGLVIGAGAMALAGMAQPGGTAVDRAQIETIVRDYIRAHPELVPEAMSRLRDRETAKQIDANRKTMETPFAGAWAGNAKGDVTLVEFFDYACGYCRTSVKDIDRLLAEDRNLRVVFRELPILSPGSDVAARASLSAARQGRFLNFHRAMYAQGAPTPETVATVSKAQGLAPAQTSADAKAPEVSAEIEANLALAQAIGLSGTPTFVVGDKLLGGAIGYDALKSAIAEVRAGVAGR